MERKCKKCGSLEIIQGRLLCDCCNKQRIKDHYVKNGKANRVKRCLTECLICLEPFAQWRKEQIVCAKCKKNHNTSNGKNPYIFTNKIGRTKHRDIAESILKCKLDSNQIVHHVDENPKNNNIDNLWVISRHHHGQLHSFLRSEKIALTINNPSLDWEKERLNQTLIWLEFSKAKVIKLIDFILP